MLITKNQFYDIIKYAESMDINPKLFEFEHISEESFKNFLGKEKKNA